MISDPQHSLRTAAKQAESLARILRKAAQADESTNTSGADTAAWLSEASGVIGVIEARIAAFR